MDEQKKNVKFLSGANTKEQDKFAELVAYGMSLKEAFIKAGYKSRHEDQPKKLAKKIRSVIMYYRRERAKKISATDEDLLKEQSAIAFFNAKDLCDPSTGLPLPINELPDKVSKCIKEMKVRTIGKDGDIVEYEYKLWDKQRALSDLQTLISSRKEERKTNKVTIRIDNSNKKPIKEKEENKNE